MTQKDLETVQEEVNRFQKRLDAMIIRSNNDSFAFYGCKESGALKRSAMDLKMELTKITQ